MGTNTNTNTFTVADLIARLSTVDPTLPVRMSMNMEYDRGVSADMVEVNTFNNVTYLYITDTPGDDDGWGVD